VTVRVTNEIGLEGMFEIPLGGLDGGTSTITVPEPADLVGETVFVIGSSVGSRLPVVVIVTYGTEDAVIPLLDGI
jgi:hypothetical protein